MAVAMTTDGSEKAAGSGFGVSIGARGSYGEGEIVGGNAHHNGEQSGEIRRGLKSRHIQFLAIGGAIGTGLFVGSGSILALTGPAPLLMGYLTLMFAVWNIMQILCEMVVFLPFKGVNAPYFARRFVEPSLGFVSAWSYWYTWAIFMAADAVAGAILLDYWNTPVPSAVWIAVYLVIILALNVFAVEFFGEAEFWFASIKFITLLGLIILGIVIFFGGAPAEGRIGFRYWNDPGAFTPYVASGAFGGFLAYWTATVRAGFAFVTSPELITQASGEAVAPRRNIPKAAGRFVWRLLFFYGCGSLIAGVVVPSNDDRLLSPESNATASPFVIGIKRAGIVGLDHVINAAILTSAWSSGNCFLFSGSRMLHGMALSADAPQIFSRTNKAGVPYVAVLATWSFGLLSFLTISSAGATVFAWLQNLSTISGFMAWIIVSITYLRFRSALRYHNQLSERPFVAALQPYATWVTLIFMILLSITNGFQVFTTGRWSVADFLASYITLPIMFALYIGHKVWFKTPLAYRLKNVDVFSGKRELDEMHAADLLPLPRESNVWKRIWAWLA